MMDVLFSKQTYLNRIKSVKESMLNENIDALIVSNYINIMYLARFPYMMGGHIYTKPQELPLYLIIPIEGEPILLAPEIEYEHAKEKSFISDIRLGSDLWSGSPKLAAKHLENIIVEKNLKRGKIGVENEWTRKGLLNFIPNSNIINAKNIVPTIRMIKSKKEIELIKLGCDYTDYGIQKLIENAYEGITEIELMNKTVFDIAQKMNDDIPALETFDNLAWIKVNSGKKTVFTHGSIAKRKLRRGDIVTLIVKAFIGLSGYHGHIVRTAFMGKPTNEQISLYQEAFNAEAETLKALYPGVKCSDIYNEVSKKRGGGGGFAMGLESHEEPTIRKTDKTEIKPGMVFYIASGIYILGNGAYKFGDNVTVTSSGYEELTKSPKELDQMII